MQSKRSGTSRAQSVGTTLSLILLVTLLTAAAALFSLQRLQPDIERDLTARVATAVQGTVSDFSIDGQDVTLIGSISSEEASKRAVESAQSVFGVGRVINNLTIDGADTTEQASSDSQTTQTIPLVVETEDNAKAPSTLTIASREGSVTVQGIVPDGETIERINNALSGKFGSKNVRDELSSFDGSVSPQWLTGIVAMVDQLDGINDPILKITGEDLVLGGTVNAEQIRRVKLATAERLLGTELNIVDNLSVVAPGSAEQSEVPETEQTKQADQKVVEKEEAVVETTALPTSNAIASATSAEAGPDKSNPVTASRPASIEITSINNQISLTGFVGSQADASGIREGLDNLFGVNSYNDELTVSDSVQSASWIDDALIVTSEIRDIPQFSVSIRAGQMSLGGNVEDRETARDFSIAATQIAGNKLGVLNNFSVTRISLSDSDEDLMAESLLQELEALPTRKIIFNKNSTTLADSAKEVLDDVAAAILGYDDLVVEIAGHTDSTGDAVTNLRLSMQRASAVRDYLVEQNVPASRLSPIGYGETAPIGDNDTEASRAANRRIEFNL